MIRRILAVTGTRAEYGSMRPGCAATAAASELSLYLIVTAMHLAPQFDASLAEIESDRYGTLHHVETGDTARSGAAMASGLGQAIIAMAEIVAKSHPALVLLQGD